MDALKYHIVTFGCQMNVHESEKLAGIMQARGYVFTENDFDADIIVFNTCCIRQSAENKIIGNLGYVKKLKEKNNNLIVAVCGCMTQQDGAADRLKKRCPFVNIIFGTHNLHKFGEYLDLSLGGQKVNEVYKAETDIIEDIPVKRSSGINAWVNIMYGCDNYCSYCVVPFVRGRERSWNVNHIVDDVKKLLDEGYKEITLLGQNVNSYSFEDINFASLLEKVSNFNGDYRIKFMTSHPKDFNLDVIKVIAGNKNIHKFIHLPPQSGSDRILNLMNRKYTASDYLNKIELIKKHIPNAGLSGDIIAAFPSETENDFLDTLNLVKQVEFQNLFMFIYSKRDGTAASKMDGMISRDIAGERFDRLNKLQFDIGNKLANQELGKEFTVLIESFNPKNNSYFGKTDNGKAVSFKSDTCKVGDFVTVKVDKVKNSNLLGTVKK